MGCHFFGFLSSSSNNSSGENLMRNSFDLHMTELLWLANNKGLWGGESGGKAGKFDLGLG